MRQLESDASDGFLRTYSTPRQHRLHHSCCASHQHSRSTRWLTKPKRTPTRSMARRHLHATPAVTCPVVLLSTFSFDNIDKKAIRRAASGSRFVVSMRRRKVRRQLGDERWHRQVHRAQCSTLTLSGVDHTECSRLGHAPRGRVTVAVQLGHPSHARTPTKGTAKTVSESRDANRSVQCGSRGASRALPVVHATVKKRIVHRIAHGEEVGDQVNVRRTLPLGNRLVDKNENEIQLLRKPARRESRR